MKSLVRTIAVVARRDFLSIVATPTFLLFLLAPLFMLTMGLAGGFGAAQIADSARGSGRIVLLAEASDVAPLTAADTRLRAAFGQDPPAVLDIRPVTKAAVDSDLAKKIAAEPGFDTFAVMTGPLAAPLIVERNVGGQSGRYLTLLAAETLRDRRISGSPPAVTARYASFEGRAPSKALRQSIAFAAVFTIFLLTLLLAGQAVGMLAEEKGNKVIEILAAAVPLESVFMGKLLGLLGVAILFIAFWATMAIGGTIVAAGYLMTDPATLAAAGAAAGSAAKSAAASPAAALLTTPATGWPFFLGIGLAYFVMAFLLLGAIFLGIGAQAGTVREIQMLSLPITIFQVAMFGLSSAAASAPGTSLARMAEIFPFSSPFAMAARAANDEAIGVHFLALGWQAIWVAAVIALSVRLFRSGVLSGRSNWAFWKRRKLRPNSTN